ncbi:uncharacterized protein LOC123320606 [Coccinella septempunctata]|nr:uncharacterized protein LOC123320606 [Coccinella septempunctata]
MKKSFIRKVKRLTHQTLLISRNNVTEEHNITDLSVYDQNAEKTLDSYSNETIEALPTSERSSIASEWISIPSNVLENASLPGPSQSDSLSFQEEIKLWAVKNQITHKAVEELLTILRKQPGLDGIPKSARSFLSTVREVKTRVVSPGTYCHLGIEKVLSDFFRMHKLIPPENLEIAVNIDGLPLSKSSGSQVYPILGVILNLNITVQNVVLIGLY